MNAASTSVVSIRSTRSAKALDRAGIEVEREEAGGALRLITKHDGHLSGGTFSADKMIKLLSEAVDDGLKAGSPASAPWET